MGYLLCLSACLLVVAQVSALSIIPPFMSLCAYLKCYNGGICQSYNLTNSGCVCPAGYKGRHCEFKVHPDTPGDPNTAYRWQKPAFKNHVGWSLSNELLQVISTNTSSVHDCQRVCEKMGTDRCKSINYRLNKKTCSISNQTRDGAPNAWKLGKWHSMYQEYTLRDCGLFVCFKTCYHGYKKDEDGCYHCECRQDPCQSNPCKTNEKCLINIAACDNFPCPPTYYRCVDTSRCPTPMCHNRCVQGYGVSQETGCMTCQCVRPVPLYKSSIVHCSPGSVKHSETACLNGTSCAVVNKCALVMKPGLCPTNYTVPHIGWSCFADKNCRGTDKCCRTSHGNKCVPPLIKNNSTCPAMLNSALSNDSLIIPNCTSQGLYQQVQCYSRDAQLRCYCVDVISGQKLTQEVLTDNKNISCNILEPFCPKLPLRCQLKQCMYGFKTDNMSCPTCRCSNRDPCKRFRCGFGLECQVNSTGCQIKPCYPKPECVPVKEHCPFGAEVLTHEDLGLPVICAPNLKNALRGKGKKIKRRPPREVTDAAGKSYCPATHYCYRRQQQRIGVCCSRSNHTVNGVMSTKLGLCPEIRNLYQYKHNQKCSVDTECSRNQKCCQSNTGIHICARARVKTSSTCQKALTRANRLLWNRILPTNFMPRCHAEGPWKRTQCHDSIGMCWCVDEHTGEPVPNTRIRGTPDCTIDPRILKNMPVCPAGVPIRRCYPWLCYLKTCLAHPNATCRIDPCGNCIVRFYDSRNKEVDCFKGVSRCEKDRAIRSYQHFIDMINAGTFTSIRRNVHSGLVDELQSYRDWQNSTITDGKKWLQLYQKYRNDKNGRGNCTDTVRLASNLNCPASQSVINVYRYFYSKRTDSCEYLKTSACALDQHAGYRIHTQCQFECTEMYNRMSGIFVPSCNEHKYHSYNATQCHDGYCFCVNTTTGEPIKASLTRGVVTCDNNGHVVNKSDQSYVCNDGSKPVFCDKTCADRCDPSLPHLLRERLNYRTKTSCIPDHCNKCQLKQKMNNVCRDAPPTECSMKTEMKNYCDESSQLDHPDFMYGSPYITPIDGEVYVYNSSLKTCTNISTEGKCVWKARHSMPGIFVKKHQCTDLCDSEVFCEGGSEPRVCGDVCQNMTCHLYPGAVCQVDPCTCQPQFLNYNGLIREDCFRNDTICEIERRAAMEKIKLSIPLPTPFNIPLGGKRLVHPDDTDNMLPELVGGNLWTTVIPECDRITGAYQPMQCGQRGKCICVDETGVPVNSTFRLTDGSNMRQYCENIRMNHVRSVFILSGPAITTKMYRFKREIKSKVYDWVGHPMRRTLVDVRIRKKGIFVSISFFGEDKQNLIEVAKELEEMLDGFKIRLMKRTYRVKWAKKPGIKTTRSPIVKPTSTDKNKIVSTSPALSITTDTAFTEDFTTGSVVSAAAPVTTDSTSPSEGLLESTTAQVVTGTNMSSPMMNASSGGQNRRKIQAAVAILVVLVTVALLIILGIYCWRRRSPLGKRRDGALTFDNKMFDPADSSVEVASGNTGDTSI